MADSIKDRTYQGTETYGQAFDRMSKGQAGYAEAVKGLADELARLNGLSGEQRQWLEDYIKGLDNVRDSWEKINDYLSSFTDTFDEFSENLDNARNLFSNIVKDLQSNQRQLNEKVTLFRNIRDLAGEIERASFIEGGYSESNLKSLNRRAEKLRDIYQWNLKNLLGVKEGENITPERLEAERTKQLEKQRDLAQEISRLKRTVGTGRDPETLMRLSNAEVRAARDELAEKRKLYNISEAIIELLSDQGIKAMDGMVDRTREMYEEGQKIRREHPGLGFAAKLAEKFGISGAKGQLDRWVQETATARKEGRPVEDPAGLKMIAGWTKDALTFTGIMTALGLTLTGIIRAFKEVSSETAKLQQNIGKFPYGIAAANSEFATSKQYLETTNELAQQFGQNPISFIGQDEIAKLAEAKNLLGLSAEQAGNVGIRSKIAGQSMDRYTESIVRGINQGNALNRSTVAHGVAMKEVLSTSDDITLSLGNSGEKLGKAIVAAKNLGMSLKDVDAIAGQLLNFESSIENEMKAQLLTGNQLNLSRARGYALQNDLKNLGEELARQNITAEKFANWNRIQQEATAAALGMSREQLGRMLVTQAGLTKLTDAQVKAATGMTKSQLEAMSITDRWKIATEKLAGAFTPLLEVITPLITILSEAIATVAGVFGHLFGWIKIDGTESFKTIGKAIGVVALGLMGLSLVAKIAGVHIKGLGLAGRLAGKGLGRGLALGIRSVGRAIGGLVSASAGIPVLLAFGAAALMVGAAIGAAAWGIGQLATGFANIFKALERVDAAKLWALGPAFLGLGTGLLIAIPGMVVGALALGPITKRLERLVKIQPGIQALAGSIVTLASAVGVLKTNLNGLEVKNLKAIRKQAVKAINSIEVGKIEAISGARAGVSDQENIKTTATLAENSKMERLMGVIADRVSGILQVEVTNWDYDKIGRQLAIQTVRD